MNVTAAFRRRAVVEPEEVDTLAPLRRRAEEFEARSKALSDRLREVDEREASLSATLDATIRAGSDADAVAAALAAIPRERAALKAQADAVARAEAETRAELAAEEKRLADLETDAEITRLRDVETLAAEEYAAALVSAGIAFEQLLAAEARLGSALTNARRPYHRGFQTPARVAWEQAEEAARGRLRSALAAGTCGASSHLEETPIPHGAFARF